MTIVGRDISLADGYATAAVAMGTVGISWLAGRDGHEAGVVGEDGPCQRSDGLSIADPRPSRPELKAS